MGYAIAEAAAARGAHVVLVSGPVALPAPEGVKVVHVRDRKRRCAPPCSTNLDAATMIIKAAAVADYHVREIPKQKMKKTAARLSLELDPTPDILAEVGQKKGDRLLIGFAAETQNLIEEARRKLQTKNCDMVVGNIVSRRRHRIRIRRQRSRAGAPTGETIPVPRASKREIADAILDQALRLRLALHRAAL